MASVAIPEIINSLLSKNSRILEEEVTERAQSLRANLQDAMQQHVQEYLSKVYPDFKTIFEYCPQMVNNDIGKGNATKDFNQTDVSMMGNIQLSA